MAQDEYLGRIEERLDSLIDQIAKLLEYLYAESTTVKAGVFGLGPHLEESNQRMERIEKAIERQTAIAENQADTAKIQAENIRLMIEMVNRKQA
jgi:hypothetical protein